LKTFKIIEDDRRQRTCSIVSGAPN
jgi:hypothetical protein